MQGISLAVRAGQIVALLGTNGAGKSTTLRAISGFLGIDDARVTEGTIVFKGERIENRPPQRDHAARHRAGARARQGVSQPDGRGKSRRAGVARSARPSGGGARSWSISSFRGWPSCAAASAGCCPAASGRCWRSPARWCAGPELLLVDELSLGLAPVVVEDLMRARSCEIRRELGITIVIVEQSAAVALADRRLRLRAGERPHRARRRRRRACASIPTSRSSISAKPAAASAAATATVKQYRRSRRWYG